MSKTYHNLSVVQSSRAVKRWWSMWLLFIRQCHISSHPKEGVKLLFIGNLLKYSTYTVIGNKPTYQWPVPHSSIECGSGSSTQTFFLKAHPSLQLLGPKSEI
jgi:hypothetical protein